MLERLQDYLYSEPGRLSGIGKLLAQFGVFLFLAGAIGHFATSTINVLPTLAKQPETTKTLADIYPTLPLWWVPETWLGVITSVILAVAGICIALHGKSVDRMLKAF